MLRSLVWLSAMAAACGVLLYLFVLDTWIIPKGDPVLAAALQPTLAPEDRILTRRGTRPPRGVLARCRRPDNATSYVIGRLFGLEGDTIEVNNERVAVDGKSVPARFGCGSVYVVHPVSGATVGLTCSVEDSGTSTYGVLVHPGHRERQRVARVATGKAYIVSDNRHFHLDSRDFGQVDVATCEPVIARLWGARFSDASRRFNILW